MSVYKRKNHSLLVPLCLFCLFTGYLTIAQTTEPAKPETTQVNPVPDNLWDKSLGDKFMTQLLSPTDPNVKNIGAEDFRSSNIHYEYDLFIADIDGTHAFPITQNLARECNPAFSPDNKSIVYEVCDSIWVMTCDGKQQQLTDPTKIKAKTPSWSPSGKQILFCAQDGLYLMYVDGTGLFAGWPGTNQNVRNIVLCIYR